MKGGKQLYARESRDFRQAIAWDQEVPWAIMLYGPSALATRTLKFFLIYLTSQLCQ